jgi:xanthine/uracil permease
MKLNKATVRLSSGKHGSIRRLSLMIAILAGYLRSAMVADIRLDAVF